MWSTTLRTKSHNHTCTLWFHRPSSEPSNQTGPRISLSTFHTSTSSHRAFCRSASLSPWDRPMPLKDRGGHRMARDRHRPASEPHCSTSAEVSMEDYVPSYVAANSGPSETPCCIFRKWIGSSPAVSLVTGQSLLHLDLQQEIWFQLNLTISPEKLWTMNSQAISNPQKNFIRFE